MQGLWPKVHIKRPWVEGGEHTETNSADPHILRRDVNVWDKGPRASETRTLINACNWCNMYA